MNITQNTLNILEKRIESLNAPQKLHFQKFREASKFVSCLPVGCGKGYLVFTALLDKIINTDEKVFCIATHRLLLNKQHLRDLISTFSSLAGQIGFVVVGSGSIPSRLESYYPSIDKVRAFLATNRHLGRTKEEILKNLPQENKEIKKDIEQYFNYLEYQRELGDLPFSKTIFRTTRPNGDQGDSIREKVQAHLNAGRKVILISTYHSLCRLGRSDTYDPIHIDSIFLDEAHMLASEKETEFTKGFDSLSFTNNYSLTATPKEADDNTTRLFLMDNQERFGETLFLSFKEAVELGLIVSPIIHTVRPIDIEDFDNNPVNRANFTHKSFGEHRILVKSVSANPDNMGAKMMVKCASVGKDLWPIYNNLIGKDENIIIFAGASKREEVNTSGEDITDVEELESYVCSYYSSPEILAYLGRSEEEPTYEFIEEELGKRDFLETIQALPQKADAIVLHFDILSEGINVSGFTGVMFIGGRELTETKYIQNIGRTTRLAENDRDNLKEGLISIEDKTFVGKRLMRKTWDKPYCWIIVPYWEEEGESGRTRRDIEHIIARLRELDIKTRIVKQSGNDDPDGGYEPPSDSNVPEVIPDGVEFDDDFLHEVEIEVERQAIEKEEHQKETIRTSKAVATTDDEWDDYILSDEVEIVDFLEKRKLQ